jgi:2-hydroxyglutarate dehydrogenase
VRETPPSSTDLAVVGGGIIGLAFAREMLLRHGGLRLVVLEREDELAMHQTGHNSGVVHAGIYYAPGSLKARLCVEGAHALYAFCERRGIAHERCGKLIVATEPGELAGLDELERRGRANGVPDLARVDAAGIERIEPHARGIAALHSPFTGIVDFRAVALALADDVREAGGEIVTGCAVTGIEPRDGGVRLTHASGALDAGHLVTCAGAWSDRVAVAAGADPDPRIVPFRGAYLKLAPERRELVRGLIYPVPDPSLPFLGVHLSRHTSGEVLVGPTALLAPRRDTFTWPGTWRMMRRWWRHGAIEMRHAASRRSFVRAANRFVPELCTSDVEPAFAGVRAQALGRDGRLVDDFVFSETAGALHVRNAPSPAATSSLAIARLIADRAEAAFSLPTSARAPGRSPTAPA